MNIHRSILAATIAVAALSSTAFAQHPISIGVDNYQTGNLIVKANGSLLQSGEFIMRLGYFNFDANYALNNAAIAANANNLGVLEGAFTTYFTFGPAEQAQGDLGIFGQVNGVADPGEFYAYLEQNNTTYNGGASSGGFIGKNMYAWVQLNGNPAEQLIGANEVSLFPVQNDPFQGSAGLTLSAAAGADIIVGVDRTASPSADYQLVPEPTTAALVLLGLAGMAMRRQRRAVQA